MKRGFIFPWTLVVYLFGLVAGGWFASSVWLCAYGIGNGPGAVVAFAAVVVAGGALLVVALAGGNE